MAHAQVQVRTSWWLRPYHYLVAAAALVTGREPNWRRVERISARGIKVKVR